MLTRTYTTNLAGRSSSMRRQRRRHRGDGTLLCNTNGCATRLVLEPEGGVARCPICGYERRLH